MLVEEVYDADRYSTDRSTIWYRLRDRSRASALTGPVSRIGDTTLGTLGLSAVIEELGTEIDFVDEHPKGICIMSVLSGAVGFRNATTGREDTCSAGSLAIFEVEPGSCGYSADATSRINLWVPRSRLLRRLEATLERPLATSLRFASADRWPPGVVSSLQRLVAFATREIEDPYSMLAGGTGAAEFEELVLRTLLDGVPNSYTDLLGDPRAPAPALAYRRALDFMRAHLTEPLTVASIAAHVGCSPRALANECRARSGATVSTVLRNMRLDAAHADFVRNRSAAGIVEVARNFQFSNPGRFSRHYRTRFGESPSHIVKRNGATSTAQPASSQGSLDKISRRWTDPASKDSQIVRRR